MTFKEWKELHKKDFSITSIITEWNAEINDNFDLSLKDTLVKMIGSELELRLSMLNNYELIYPVSEIDDDNDLINVIQFKSIIKYMCFKCYAELKNMTAYINKDLEDYQTTSKGINTTGYAGYDLQNQDGDFQKYTNEFLSGDKLRYYSFLNKRVQYFGEWVIIELKSTLLRGIY